MILVPRNAAALAILLTCSTAAIAQSADESLGPKDTGGKKTYLLHEMETLNSVPKPALASVHPRVYFTRAELDQLRAKAHGPQKQWWNERVTHLRVFQGAPPSPPAEKRRAQNEVALAIAEAAFAYKIDHDPEVLTAAKLYMDAALSYEVWGYSWSKPNVDLAAGHLLYGMGIAYKIDHDPKVLAAAKQYMDAALSYDVWGYSWSKPNVDLAAGHLLYGMGIAYDLLYNDLTPSERARYRDSIAHHAHLLYEYFAPRPGRTWSFSQNHTFIPITGLAVAAYALYGETPEAAKWAALSRAIYDRVLATYSKDGYYFEGFEYWIFSTPWIIHYLDAQRHVTGEDLFDQPGLHQSHLYVAHSVTPGGEMMFDFGDVFEGPITRSRKGDDYERSHPNGHFETNYNLLYDLASHFHDPQIQGVADYLRSLGQTGQEEWWTLAWRDDSIKPEHMSQVPTHHWFRDHDVAFWRSDWTTNATAIAFKCGPAEGHAAAALEAKYPDWHFEQGHAHPDVNSFIVWAKGAYLTGDSGYSGVPKTIDHNTLLIDGKGQGNDGNGHDAWAKYDYARLNETHIAKADFTATGFILIGEGAGAYDASLGLKQFTRRIELRPNTGITVNDTLAAEGNHTFTEALHADGSIQQTADSTFLLKPVGNSTAILTAKLLSPPDAQTTIEPNVVMGPGIPGSVDKGKLEQRGERVVATTPRPTSATNFEWSLQF